MHFYYSPVRHEKSALPRVHVTLVELAFVRLHMTYAPTMLDATIRFVIAHVLLAGTCPHVSWRKAARGGEWMTGLSFRDEISFQEDERAGVATVNIHSIVCANATSRIYTAHQEPPDAPVNSSTSL